MRPQSKKLGPAEPLTKGSWTLPPLHHVTTSGAGLYDSIVDSDLQRRLCIGMATSAGGLGSPEKNKQKLSGVLGARGRWERVTEHGFRTQVLNHLFQTLCSRESIPPHTPTHRPSRGGAVAPKTHLGDAE